MRSVELVSWCSLVLGAACSQTASPAGDAALVDAAATGDASVDDAATADGAALPSSRYLVYNRQVAGHKHLFRARVDGTEEVQLTSGDNDNVYPMIHGDTVYFSS